MIERFKGETWKMIQRALARTMEFYNQIEPWQRMSAPEVTRRHEERMTNLLAHAAKHVPYYARVLRDAGVVNGSGAIDLRHFSRIPLLDKPTIRQHFESLKSDDLRTRKWYCETSGGSTGEPVRLVQDMDYKWCAKAGSMLTDSWTGYHVGMKKVLLWGSERDLFVGRETPRIRFLRWLRNEEWCNVFRVTPELMRQYVEAINRHRPVQILAYAGSIYELARFIQQEGLSVYSPKGIMTSAGTLYPYMRQPIEEVFRAPVFNRYGSREVGNIATECERHEGLHITMPTHHVEVLREDGSPAATGEVGEIVVTLLTNFSMPLIRYRIGDMATRSDKTCSCGRAWPMLGSVTGRVTDTFIARNGTQVHGEYFTHLMYFQDWVEKFQVVQEEVDLIRMVIKLKGKEAPPEDSATRREIVEKVRLVMGSDCRVAWDFVPDIAPTASGKFRYTLSKVAR